MSHCHSKLFSNSFLKKVRK
uniref:Uncharacterized protein n=1 Tax=Anguilla anguilla TaxID=7936 RepID=A0A0E9VG72_ANGAN